MIYITQGEVNEFVLTLTERATIVDPVYLFKFTWETDVEDVAPLYWIGTDTSLYTYRYNLFTLDEGTDVTFRIGQYEYQVYESATGSTPADETGLDLIEEGRLMMPDTDNITNTIYD